MKVNDDVLGRWDYSQAESWPYGDETTYRKAMEFLDGPGTVEDWGCGTAYAKRFLKVARYVGVDGSPSRFCDVVDDLRRRRSSADGILVRHVLEHNIGWREILLNAVASFRRRLALVVFTPFEETTRIVAMNRNGTPDISFRRLDLVDLFGALAKTEEPLRTATQYGQEHVFYVTR